MRKLMTLAAVGTTGVVGLFGLGVNTAAHATCPKSNAPSSGGQGVSAGGTPVYTSPPGGLPTNTDANGYIGVDGGSNGSIEANSAGQPAATSIQNGTGYIVAQGSSPAGSGGVVVKGMPPTVTQC
ncbi:MAG: hypothetical protein ACYDAD_12775 [Acidimicrobiales bacterium]